MSDAIRIFPIGDAALTVEFGNVISREMNRRALGLAEHLTNNPFPGFVEAVPAYASTSAYYDAQIVRRNFPHHATAFGAIEQMIRKILASDLPAVERHRTIEVPVAFGGDAGPDIQVVADFAKVSPSEVIEIFTSGSYRVYMLGFLPGFAYMGEVDKKIAAPRKDTPRTSVPRGSVGIAGLQTGVYSLESPGGWQLIGRTDLMTFDATADEPTLFQPGDEVKFIAAK